MTVQFLIGRAGSGKSTYMMNEMKKELIGNPEGPPIIYLVPDQMTFQAEYEFITTPEITGMIRVQVFSFSRLALRILQETGGITRTHIDRVGTSMIFRRIIENRKQELKVFQRSSEQQGFYEHLDQMITECKRYCISPEQFLTAQEESNLSPLLKDKLHDLHLIYAEFKDYLVGRYLDSEDYLRLLAEKIPRSNYISQATIFVDGFHLFTPQEQEVLLALMKQAKQIKFSLTVDKIYDEELPHDLHLFYPTARTYQQLRDLALTNHIKIEQPLLFTNALRYKQEPALAHIEKYYDHRPLIPFKDHSSALTFYSAVNRRAEVEGVAREMIHLVREKGYRWREMAILVRDVTIYQDLIETMFKDYEIPIFIDQKRPMIHPLIELIKSSLDCLNQHWRYEAVFRCIKTDLLYPWENETELRQRREEYDFLENYVLAYGVKGEQWVSEKPWEIFSYRNLDEEENVIDQEKKKEEEEKLHSIRLLITNPILQLRDRFSKADNVREMCEALFYFLEEQNIPQKLEYWSQAAIEQGDLRKAREHKQVWDSVLHLLDQLVEIMGDESLSLEMFSKMIESGCDVMKFSLVPPALDQVLVGDIEKSRFSHVKSAFIIGCNDGILPAKMKEDGIITEEEREWLAVDGGVQLAPSSRQKLIEEEFLIYTALSTASERLYVSYSLADEEGRSLTPSMVMARLKNIFPQVKEKLIVNEPYETTHEEQFSFVSSPSKSLSYLTSEIRQWKKGYPMADFWWDVYNWAIQNPEWRDKTQTVLSSIFYQNVAKPLSQEMSKQLYGESIQLSVSRMEKYTSCPFSQYLSHGLRLKERQVFRLEAPDVGQLFHASLKVIDDLIKASGKTWKEITKADCLKLAQIAVDQLAPRLQKNILFSSHRHHFIKRKLQQVVERASTVLSEHAKSSEFVPIGLEIEFGSKGQLPGLTFTLDNGVKMELVGRIDRVDQAKGSNGLLLRVVDYKSSLTTLDLSKVYYGLSLQMLTYLDIVITHSKSWLGTEAVPAGVLYFHVHNPLLSRTTRLPQDLLDKELYKQFKMKGLVLADQEAVQLMDTTLESQHSEIIPVALKKDGQFYSSSSVANEEEFQQLRHFVRKQIKQIGTKMTSGHIEIKPFKMKKMLACTFCPYKSVCQFDLEMDDNEYESLPGMSRNDMLALIKQKGEIPVE